MDSEAEGEELCLDCQNDTGSPDTALLEASTVGLETCLEFLLNDGVTDNITAALVVAASAGYIKCVKSILRSKKMDMEHENVGIALHSAACEGHSRIVKLLIETGADVNMTDEDGQTVLGQTIQQRCVKAVEILIHSGADVNCKDEIGCTPLMHTAMIGDINVMKLLIDAGADVNRSDCKGNTALLISSQQDRGDIVKLLINSGSDVNIPDETGKTALMMASEQGNENMIDVLLKSGLM